MMVLTLGLTLSASAQAPDPLAPLFTADQAEARAALLIVDGRVVAKHYAPGYSDANRFISWSMAKSVTALLIGELVADGRLQLDAPAPIAEWQNDGRREITLRHLLHMSSGLRHIEVGKPVENSDTNQLLFVSGTGDMAARSIARPLAAAPGTRFNYDSMTSLILSEIVTRALTPSRDPRVRAQAYRAFAEDRLFRPARVTSAVLEFDGAGTQIGGSIMHLSLDDWGRMGRLLLDGKGADGRTQVIAPEWLAFMKVKAPNATRYAGHVWLSPNGLVSMRGHLGQFVFTGERNGRTVILVRLGKTQDNVSKPVIAALERLGGSMLAVQPGAATPAP